MQAILAQLAEHRIRNAGVRGSIPRDGSNHLQLPRIATGRWEFCHAASMILYSLRFFWTASRGYRLRPWQSPYLRWRIETYSGLAADQVSCGIFWKFLWKERKNIRRFLHWGAEMKKLEKRLRRESVPPRPQDR